MNKITLLLMIICVAGCTAFVDATTNKTIQQDTGKRSFGQVIDDESLETIITVNLKKAGPALSKAQISVTSFNGVVLLTGEVAGKEIKQRAGEIVRDSKDVRQVHNQLLVKSNSNLFSRTNDGWISTRVRSKIERDGRVAPERVKIITENRIVYLMGLLTHKEARVVSELAAGISGVEQVVRAIEYIEH